MSVEIACNMDGVEEFKTAIERFGMEMRRNVQLQLESWAREVEATAKQLVPVKTGYLRSTINAKAQDWVAEVDAEAVYALHVEFGTRYVRARPFLFPAVERNLPRLEPLLLDALDSAKTEAGLT